MALSSQGIELHHSTTENGTYAKLVCIKDIPDMGGAEADQIETTTLCDTYHEYIDGLKNYGDDLEFTANYDEAVFGTLKGYETANSEQYFKLMIGDSLGSDGIFSFSGLVRVRLNSASVGDVLEMTIIVKLKSEITFTAVP